MGGVEGTLDDGLTKFKDNFNPTINEFIGEFDIPIYPFMYRLTQKAYKILEYSTHSEPHRPALRATYSII